MTSAVPHHLRVRANPARFRAIAGMEQGEFDQLVEAIRPRFETRERDRLTRSDRVRAIGGGPPFGLDLADQVLLVLTRARHRPTLLGLSATFGVSIWTAMRAIRRVAPLVEAARLGPDQPSTRSNPRGDRGGDARIFGLFALDPTPP